MRKQRPRRRPLPHLTTAAPQSTRAVRTRCATSAKVLFIRRRTSAGNSRSGDR